MPIHPVIAEVTQQVADRSRVARTEYLARMAAARMAGPARRHLSCSNFAHVFAAAGADKPALRAGGGPNIGIVTAYNDMLSAHQPFEEYPEIIRAAAREAGATAQVAGGVPAMCDGVTQGRPGMELSLFSRDVIALATALALSHDSFDAGLLLGVCDKIVPGLFIGAASFGHLPLLFVSAGPMPSGLSNLRRASCTASLVSRCTNSVCHARNTKYTTSDMARTSNIFHAGVPRTVLVSIPGIRSIIEVGIHGPANWRPVLSQDLMETEDRSGSFLSPARNLGAL